MSLNPLYSSNPQIKFGTDGWRGIIGVDITLERLLVVASAAAQELAFRAPKDLKSRKIIIGYDRRFLAAEFAEAICAAVRGSGLEPLLANSPVPTPSCSWAVVHLKALGALVITASHNPPEWLGLKIKGPLGGSVEGDFTSAVEKRLLAGSITVPEEGTNNKFDCKKAHLEELRRNFDLPQIIQGLQKSGLRVIVDPMHGSAAGCMRDLFAAMNNDSFFEIRSHRDPLFGGHPPEPLASNLKELINEVRKSVSNGKNALGIVFDGDGDRIAAIDEKGRFCSTQLLMPLLIDHLIKVRKLSGCVIKTVSGSDLMQLISEELGIEVIELPVGFKYIASEMLSRKVLIGGEESGGIGFGGHIPERDALYAALMLLEALTQSSTPLGQRLDELENAFCPGYYDRIDILLPDMATRKRLDMLLKEKTPSLVAGEEVQEVVRIDGIKLIVGKRHWVMFRFSGTEPLLRIYCEAPSQERVSKVLAWANDLAKDS